MSLSYPKVLAFLVPVLALACTSTENTRSETPAPRAHHQLVHQESTDRAWLIGGSTRHEDGYHYFRDTWIAEGSTWHRTFDLPFPRSSHRVVYDTTDDTLLLFGGGFGKAVRMEGIIWKLEDAGWKAVDGNANAAATEPGMCHDRKRKETILFGGWGPNGLRSDTWSWDGDNLEQVATDGPAARAGHAIEYDPVREQCLLFGGRTATGQAADTWTWNGERWQELRIDGPSPREFFGAATDHANNRIVIFGGRGPDAPQIGRDGVGDLGDTWAWDGHRWQQLATDGPAARSMAKMAGTRQGILLFGGRIEYPKGFEDHGDTWLLLDDHWIRKDAQRQFSSAQESPSRQE